MPIYNRKQAGSPSFEQLRQSLADDVEKLLSPIAVRYGYSDEGLETHIKWQPCVLVLGNYSSGKSSLINELLGAEIQATGQAPTDDSFNIICRPENLSSDDDGHIRTVSRRDGKTLVSDDSFPFKRMRRHGDRFAAHFKMQEVNSPFLGELAIIDTPGMLDSASENDRGYNYQDVIGDLAEVSDLILILFDPHKAGTVRETHDSLRNTLPMKTMEDRLIFVLNRIDECQNLEDLVRVYGTLCWNLSQMTGRKDIPPIYLTYSEAAREKSRKSGETSFLDLIKNQREELRQRILDTPKSRLDRLATYLETHAHQLGHYLEGLESYLRRLKWRRYLSVAWALAFAILGAGMSTLIMGTTDPSLLGSIQHLSLSAFGGLIVGLICFAWQKSISEKKYERSIKVNLEQLTPLRTQDRRDSWRLVEERFKETTAQPDCAKLYNISQIKRDRYRLKLRCDEAVKAARTAISQARSQ